MMTEFQLQISNYIKISTNIYDLYIQLYSFLKKHQTDAFNAAEQSLQKNLNIISNILENKEFNNILTESNRSKLQVIFSDASDEDILSLSLALFNSIDLIFGNKDYRYSKDECDILERIEVLNCLNSSITFEHGKVFYKTSSYLDALFSEDAFIRENSKTETTIDLLQTKLLIYKSSESDYKVSLSKIKCPYINNRLDIKKKPLKISLVPLTGDINYIKFVKKSNKVYVKKLNNEKEYIEKILHILDELKSKNIDIVVFPEMVFTENILFNVKKYLNSNKDNFALIISGSIWRDKKNQCVVISGDGIEISRQLKLNPYHETIYFNKYGNNEGIFITSADKRINILDIEKIGRIATPICADFISEGFYSELEKTGVNVSFIPAYTPSLSAFKTNASRLGTSNLGCSFISNCCIPIINDKDGNKKLECNDISFSFVPLKKNMIGQNFMSSCNPIMDACNHLCKNYCYFLISFTENACEFEKVKV